jgi:hypothetical protein
MRSTISPIYLQRRGDACYEPRRGITITGGEAPDIDAKMDEVKLYMLLGLQLVPLPEEYRLDAESVYVVRDGIGLRLIPATDEGKQLLDKELREFLTDPERVALRKRSRKPRHKPDPGET